MWATNLEAWPAAERMLKCFRTNKPIALIVSTRPPEQNFLFWARDVHISLLTRVKEAKFEAAPVAGRKAKPSGPNKRQRLLAATQNTNAHRPQLGSDHGCQKPVHQVHRVLSVCPWLLCSATRVNTDLLSPLLQRSCTWSN